MALNGKGKRQKAFMALWHLQSVSFKPFGKLKVFASSLSCNDKKAFEKLFQIVKSFTIRA